MNERNYNFDHRVPVFMPPEGKVNVRCYGLPVAVTAAHRGETTVGNSGITERQFRELAVIIESGEIPDLANLKSKVARGEDVTMELLHLNPHLIEMSFSATGELRSSGGFLSRGYEHVVGCEHCSKVLSEKVKDY